MLRPNSPWTGIPLMLLLCLLLAGVFSSGAQNPEPREVAVTFDDLPLSGPSQSIAELKDMTRSILAALTRFDAPAVGLVNEQKLQAPGESETRTALLKSWLESGAELGNHTFSHPSLNRTTADRFIEDIQRGETVTRRLLAEKGDELTYFRHPYLHTGREASVRSQVEAWLFRSGYRVAPVTLENVDWIFNVAWLQARKRQDAQLEQRVLTAYLDFTDRMFDFFEEATLKVVGRPIRHVLLLHANPINARALPELLQRLKNRGYRFIRLKTALEDPAYTLPDRYLGPAGVNWIFRWDEADGNREVDWSLEPQPPDFVDELYRSR